jgi:oligosaccharide repeat unit polymerase
VDNTDIVTRPRFPTSVGILLGIALCTHLAAVADAVFGQPMPGATLFLVGQLALSLALLRLYDKAWVLQDIRLVFILFFFLYGGTLPLIMASSGSNSAGLPESAFLYGTGLLAFNLVQWWYKRPWRDLSQAAFARIRPTVANGVVLVLAFVFIIGYAKARGVQFAFGIERGNTNYLGTQLFTVMVLGMNGLAMFMFAGWSEASRTTKILAVCGIAGFVLFHLSLGSRRDYLAMFIFLAGVIATKRQAVIRLWTVVAGSILFVALSALGILRHVLVDPSLLARGPVDLFLSGSEFVSPIQTLIHYVNISRPLRWGWTYLSAPTLFIPRSIWPDKPESLSLQFARDTFGGVGAMGFAYTPVTEAFINFGWLGPVIVLSLLSVLMVKLVRNADAHPGLYFICFAWVVDFNRGDFSDVFYSLVFVGGAYTMMQWVSRLRWVSGTGRTTPSQAEVRPPAPRAALNY